MFVLRHVLRWCLQLVTILVPKHVAEAKNNWYAPSVGIKESVIGWKAPRPTNYVALDHIVSGRYSIYPSINFSIFGRCALCIQLYA